MTATTIISLLLGLAAFATSVFAVITQIRDRGRSVRKQEGAIKIDSATEQRIVAEAAQIHSVAAIAQQTWWKEQFEYLRVELNEEQALRRSLTRWAKLHQEWDKRAWELALESDPEYPAPPILENGL